MYKDYEGSNAEKLPESKRAVLEKVDTKFGCVAGSGSDFFPIYRRHRNTELERLEQMDKDYEELREGESFQSKREAAQMADDQATATKKAKRQRRKDAKKEGARLRKEADGINEFAGDGSFLEAMQKMTPEELEALAKKNSEREAPAGVPKMPVVSAQQMSSSANIKIRDADD